MWVHEIKTYFLVWNSSFLLENNFNFLNLNRCEGTLFLPSLHAVWSKKIKCVKDYKQHSIKMVLKSKKRKHLLLQKFEWSDGVCEDPALIIPEAILWSSKDSSCHRLHRSKFQYHCFNRYYRDLFMYFQEIEMLWIHH